jgi:hypothetical protein
MVMGAFWEASGGIWFSNAKSMRDLAGPFQTGHINLIWATLQLDSGDNGVRVWSITMGQVTAQVYINPRPMLPYCGILILSILLNRNPF